MSRLVLSVIAIHPRWLFLVWNKWGIYSRNNTPARAMMFPSIFFNLHTCWIHSFSQNHLTTSHWLKRWLQKLKKRNLTKVRYHSVPIFNHSEFNFVVKISVFITRFKSRSTISTWLSFKMHTFIITLFWFLSMPLARFSSI